MMVELCKVCRGIGTIDGKTYIKRSKNLNNIMNVGGFSVLVDEGGIEMFRNMLEQLKRDDVPRKAGIYFDLLTSYKE